MRKLTEEQKDRIAEWILNGVLLFIAAMFSTQIIWMIIVIIMAIKMIF